jgi:hypothetical protein
MEYEFSITFEKKYIKVISNGSKNFEVSKLIWTNVVEYCKKYDNYRVLGIANTTKAISTLEGFRHNELFNELGIDHNYKIAWVELNSKMLDTYKFVETVLSNRGLPGKLFSNIEEAEKWLLS